MTSSNRKRFLVFVAFILAALVRLALDTGRGYEGDVETYLSLTWKTVHYGIRSAYDGLNGVAPSDNPPVLLYPFRWMGCLYQRFISPSFPPPSLTDAKLLRFLLRLPSLVADLLIGAFIFRFLQRKSIGFSASLLGASAYLLNPAVIFDSAYWGQTAAVHTLFMVLAMIAAERKAHLWAGAALSAAILTKPQALALAPIILLTAARERGWWRISVGGLVAATIIVAPFLLAGNISGVFVEYLNTARYHPVLSANAHNLWWLVTGGHGWQPDNSWGDAINLRTAGLLLFGGATLLSSAAIWRQRQALFVAGSYQSLAFFMLNTQIHENHLLPMFAPLAIVAALDRNAWRWLYGALTFTALANMVLHDPNLLGWLGYPEEEIYGGTAFAIPRWLNAAAQTALLIVFTLQLIKSLRSDRDSLPTLTAAD